MKRDELSPPAKAPAATCPWETVAEDGADLAIEDFPTTLLVQLANQVKRSVTSPYADSFGLSVPEWRVLSLVASMSPVPFGGLVNVSASDKALVSRTLRVLEERGLVVVGPDAGGNKKKLTCTISRKGLALYRKVMPVARRRQAELLRVWTQEERVVMYGALKKLSALF